MEIKSDIKNELLGRRELVLLLDYDKNPSFVDAAKLIADNFKVSEENVLVENIYGGYGRRIFKIQASIYDTKELKEKAQKRMIKVKKAQAPPQ